MKTALTSSRFWLALGASLIFGLGVSVRAATQPTLVVVSPTQNQQVAGPSVQVKLALSGLSLVDYKTHLRNVSGQGHVHLWLDQDTLTKTSAVKSFAETYTFENVKPGAHALVVELVNNDHSSLSPPVVVKSAFSTVPTPTATSALFSSSIFMTSVLAFLLLVLALYFLHLQIKVAPSSGRRPQKSSRRSSKTRARK